MSENLMKERYKVVADYPFSPYSIGELVKEGSNKCPFHIANINYVTYNFDKEEIEKYPHLFRKLEWWEYRSPENLPKYVKLIAIPKTGSYWLVGDILKVSEWQIEMSDKGKFWCATTEKHPAKKYLADFLEPATLEEFTNYQNKQNDRI